MADPATPVSWAALELIQQRQRLIKRGAQGIDPWRDRLLILFQCLGQCSGGGLYRV